MLHLARLSIRRPRAALAAWAIVAAALALIGLGVSHSLSPSITVVPGSESSRAQRLSNGEFGLPCSCRSFLKDPLASSTARAPSSSLHSTGARTPA
jgi:uncharacterized membrane protein YdfJ with MMPL/SSD domain